MVLKQVSLGYYLGLTWLLGAPPQLWSLSLFPRNTFDVTNLAVDFVVFCLPLLPLRIQSVIKCWGIGRHSQAKDGEEEKRIPVSKNRREKEINEDLIGPMLLEHHSLMY
jgi:hypothetical protein